MRLFLDTDLPELKQWMDDRGLETKQKPSTVGLIEPGVAAGFLYITDSNLALLDLFITNPKVPFDERDRAIYKIGESLEDLAREMGFECLIWFTKNGNMVMRGINKGFKAEIFTVLRKDITDGPK